jgi:hypothetical protein
MPKLQNFTELLTSAAQAIPSFNEDFLNGGRFYLEGHVILKKLALDLKEVGPSKY